MLDARPRRAGERKPNPELASTFRRLAAHGAKKGFTGPVAEAIVGLAVARRRVVAEDLATHATSFPSRWRRRSETPSRCEAAAPNHGVAALLAMNVFEAFTADATTEIARARG